MTERSSTTDIGAVTEALSHILGNTLRLASTTLNFRWNVVGPFAIVLHGVFKDQADELWAAADDLGEALRAIDAPASGEQYDPIILPCVQELTDAPVCQQMKCILLQAHTDMCTAIEAALDVALAEQDLGTAGILTTRLNAHRRHRRLLAAASIG